jgi:hypothetical protein
MNKDKQIIWLAGITLLVIVMLPYLGLVPKFAVTDNDFIYDGEVQIVSNSISNKTISYSYNNQTFNYPAERIYYIIGTTVYDSIPDLEGTNIINRYKITLINNDTEARLEKWHTIYTKEIQTETQNVTVYKNVSVNITGPTVYVQNVSYKNITVNQTVEVIKEVQIEPTFFERYGLSGFIFITMGLIIIYLIYKRTR